MALSKFGAAFKAARARGDKTFTFGGKSYTTKTKDDEAKAKKPDVSKAKEAPRMDSITEARVYRNKLEQAAMKGKPEIIKPVGKSPKKIGEDGKLKNVNPVDMSESRRLEPKAKAPDIMKTPGKADDTSLSVNERFKRDTKDNLKAARNSNTGTDKRSVSERIKEAIGMKKGGMVKKASAKKGSVARGGGAATRGTKFQGVF